MDASWKQDPRLKTMSREKLDFLTQFAERIEKTPQNGLMEALMSVNTEARRKNVRFDDRETELLVRILTANMPPGEKKKVELLKMMSQRMAGPRQG